MEIKAGNRVFPGWKELWNARELFYFFAWRDIKVKYKQTVLGFAWAVLQPVLMMAVFTVFFGKVLHSELPPDIPYPAFVFAGLVLWNLFSTGLTNAAGSMVTHANMIKKIYFPRLIIPLSSIIVAVFDFLMTLLPLIALLIYYGISFHAVALIYVPAALVLAVTASCGAGCLLSALTVKYRDFRYIVPFLVQFLLFVTPVIYPDSLVHNQWSKLLLQLNPMTGAIHLMRCGIFDLQPNLSLLAVSSCSGIILLLTGIITFRKTESYFADIA